MDVKTNNKVESSEIINALRILLDKNKITEEEYRKALIKLNNT